MRLCFSLLSLPLTSTIVAPTETSYRADQGTQVSVLKLCQMGQSPGQPGTVVDTPALCALGISLIRAKLADGEVTFRVAATFQFTAQVSGDKQKRVVGSEPFLPGSPVLSSCVCLAQAAVIPTSFCWPFLLHWNVPICPSGPVCSACPFASWSIPFSASP